MAECGYVVPPGAPRLPKKLDFESWVITDLETGAVLAARDPHARQRPASCIKILLSMVAIDELDPDTVVTGTHAAANQVGSKVGIGPDGHYTVGALLHGLLMQSGNDAAYALSMQLGGVQAAVTKMNALAERLGAQDTRVATPSGLDAPGMSTSAYDMSLFFSAAMEKPLFARIVGTRSYDFPGYGKKSGYVINNDNRLLGAYPGDLGGKTGYTDDALHTYVDAAQRHGHRVALVMMRGMNHLAGMYDNARKLMNYGFALDAAGSEPVGHLGAAASAPSTAGPTSPPSTGSGGGSPQTTGPVSHTSASAAQHDPPSRAPELVALLALVAVVLATAGATIAQCRSRW
jgi:D-alanyl-D-alanine carboxypeptidase (penicillin-binding protein 5/6)